MEELTNKDRRLIAEHLSEYIDTLKKPMKEDALKRVMRWAEGYTFEEIASEESVTKQAVSQQVRRIVKNINNWRNT